MKPLNNFFLTLSIFVRFHHFCNCLGCPNATLSVIFGLTNICYKIISDFLHTHKKLEINWNHLFKGRLQLGILDLEKKPILVVSFFMGEDIRGKYKYTHDLASWLLSNLVCVYFPALPR